MKTIITKHTVCKQCLSVGTTDNDCICTYSNYPTIELEFEECVCCGNIISDGNPADTDFNRDQFEKDEYF